MLARLSRAPPLPGPPFAALARLLVMKTSAKIGPPGARLTLLPACWKATWPYVARRRFQAGSIQLILGLA